MHPNDRGADALQQAADEAFAREVARLLPPERRLELASGILAEAVIARAQKREGGRDAE